MPTLATQINRVRSYLRDWPPVIDQLTAAVVSTTATTITVADATIYTARTIIQIDQEAMTVVSGTGTTLTVQRGARGTTAATHLINTPILQRPGFLDQEIIDALNAAIDACFPYIYKEVLDTTLTIISNQYEYTVPYLPSTTVYIPRIWRVETKTPGDAAWRRIEDWTIAKGATPTIKFKEVPYPSSTVRVNGYGPFPHLAATTDSTDAQWPASAEQLPILYAASMLLASGEAGRVRQTSGAVDDREQANRTGSSTAAGRDLFQRFKDGLLNGGHCSPMQAHIVVSY